MPVHAVAGGFRWGTHGHIYPTRAGAQRQAAAIYASGYREDAMRRKAARALKASRKAETGYVLALASIMQRSREGILTVARRILRSRHGLHQDAVKGLGGPLTQKLFAWQRPKVQTAFSAMAADVNKSATRATSLLGINPRHIAGVEAVIEHSREANVTLIQNASRAFLDDVTEILEETEGLPAAEAAGLLEGLFDGVEEVSKARALTIARTETLKLNSQIVQHRSRAAGVDRYQWSGSLDDRERPMHLELEGRVFSWDAPPVTNEDGDVNNPGEDYNCRCVPLPVVDELENILEEPDDDVDPADVDEEGDEG